MSVQSNVFKHNAVHRGCCKQVCRGAKLHAVEDDPRYRRVDLSSLHANYARNKFALAVERGEAGINLAEAALAVSAEDDAIVSHSTVQLPVEAFLKRIRSLSNEIARIHIPRLPQHASSEQVLQVVQDVLFKGSKGFAVPIYGRSNLPIHSILDHPGVWENANVAYLHEVLIRKQGIAATLAIIFAQVMQDLLTSRTIDFVVRIDCAQLHKLPQAEIVHGMPAEAVLRPDGTVLNMCTTDALREMLSFLKRAFWPFSWTSGGLNLGDSGSGFEGAARVALEGEASATLQAIAKTAKHRLRRGIWTSTGAGDLRRARAATERLCMLIGDEQPRERRDAAVMLLHSGEINQAAAELEAYASSAQYRLDALAAEKELVEKLLKLLHTHADYRKGSCDLITVDSVLARSEALEEEMVLPLTW